MKKKPVRVIILNQMPILFAIFFSIQMAAYGQSAADKVYAAPSIQKGTMGDAIDYSYDNPDVAVVYMAAQPSEEKPFTAGQYAARLVALAQEEGLNDIIVFCETRGDPGAAAMVVHIDGLPLRLREDDSTAYDPATFINLHGLPTLKRLLGQSRND